MFRSIVTPLIAEIKEMVREHHKRGYDDEFLKYANGESDEMIPEHMRSYINLVGNHRDELELLFFHAQGSSLENFIDHYTDEVTLQVKEFMDDFYKKHRGFSGVNTPFTYHVHTVWMFSFMSEVVKHRLTPTEIEAAIKDYVHFEYTGWRRTMQESEISINQQNV